MSTYGSVHLHRPTKTLMVAGEYVQNGVEVNRIRRHHVGSGSLWQEEQAISVHEIALVSLCPVPQCHFVRIQRAPQGKRVDIPEWVVNDRASGRDPHRVRSKRTLAWAMTR